MNLAAKDIRHNVGRFALTAIGIGLLLMIVLGMGGIYRGLIREATLLIDNIGADLWVVQGSTRGPFAEISRGPPNLEERVRAVPGVAGAHGGLCRTRFKGRMKAGRCANNLPDALSGGQQQRVAVARALANQPSLILADEPTAALDSHRGRQVMELFAKVAHKRGAAVIVVTHDQRSLDVFDRTYKREDGQLRDGVHGITSVRLSIIQTH